MQEQESEASVYREVKDPNTGTIKQQKSCPRCSKGNGTTVYKDLDAFGNRTMKDGDVIIQSWCTSCRNA